MCGSIVRAKYYRLAECGGVATVAADFRIGCAARRGDNTDDTAKIARSVGKQGWSERATAGAHPYFIRAITKCTVLAGVDIATNDDCGVPNVRATRIGACAVNTDYGICIPVEVHRSSAGNCAVDNDAARRIVVIVDEAYVGISCYAAIKREPATSVKKRGLAGDHDVAVNRLEIDGVIDYGAGAVITLTVNADLRAVEGGRSGSCIKLEGSQDDVVIDCNV